MSGLLGMVVMLTALLLSYGCNTAMVDMPGIRVLQPKDVTIREGVNGAAGLVYTDGKGATMTLQNYTSSANVAAMQAQSALLGNIVQQAVTAATTAALASQGVPAPGATGASALAATAVQQATQAAAAIETPKAAETKAAK